MAKKTKKFDYFDAFEEQAKIAIEGAKLLQSVVEDFDPEKLLEQVEKAHDIEHQGDIVCHAVYDALTVEFLAPIDRDDIVTLSRTIDDVVDRTESTLQRFYMYNVTEMRPEAIEFAKLLAKSTDALETVLEDFRNFKRSKKIRHLLRDVHDIEEEGDKLFFESMRTLHTEGSDALYVFVWSSLLQRFENSLDACAAIAGTIGSILLKNS